MNQRDRVFREWGLTDNPFISLPPHLEEDRKHVFTGRHNEIGLLKNMTTRPRGMFLVGMFGVGKSILVLETLRQLREQGRLALYAKYNRHDGFLLSILRHMCRDYHYYNPPVVNTLLDRATETHNSLHGLTDLLEVIATHSGPMTLVVDDLDKESDLGSIDNIVLETRQLIELGCAVVLLGHPVGVTAELSSSADILHPVPLGPLSESELVEMMGKYLSLGRKEDISIPDSTHPFTPNAAQVLARGISEFELTPRIFNFASQLLLEQAARDGATEITEHYVVDRWQSIAENFIVRGLRDEDRQHLEAIYTSGGVVSEDTRHVVQQIGGPFAEYVQVRETLNELIQRNVLIERHQSGKRHLELNKLLSAKNNKIFR